MFYRTAPVVVGWLDPGPTRVAVDTDRACRCSSFRLGQRPTLSITKRPTRLLSCVLSKITGIWDELVTNRLTRRPVRLRTCSTSNRGHTHTGSFWILPLDSQSRFATEKAR